MRFPSRTLVGALLAVLISASACTSGDDAGPAAEPGAARTGEEQPAEPTVLRLGVVGVESFDPAQVNAASTSQSIVADLLYDGLTEYDASSSTVVGAIARGWSISADGLVWTFDLDPDAVFSDGTPITAADAKASLERVVRLGLKSVTGLRLASVDGYDEFLAAPAQGLRGIDAADDETLVVRLREPFATLDALLSDPSFGIVPANSTNDPSGFASTPVGSGPFVVTGRETDQFTLLRSPSSGAQLDRIALRVFADATSSHAALRAGELDLSVIASDVVADANSQGGLVLSAPQQVSLFYGMNTTSGRLSSPLMRQAIVHAVDRDGIRREQFGDAADTMTGPIGPGIASHRQNACGARCDYNPEAAKQLVAQAFPDGQVPTVHLDHYIDATGREAAIAQAIVEDLAAVGIPAVTRAHEWDTYEEVLTSGATELFRFGWIGAYPAPDAYLATLFSSTGSDNVFSLADPELDGLLAAMRAQPDVAARDAGAIVAEDRLLGLFVILPLVQYRSHLAASGAVTGVVVAPNGTFDAERIFLS